MSAHINRFQTIKSSSGPCSRTRCGTGCPYPWHKRDSSQFDARTPRRINRVPPVAGYPTRQAVGSRNRWYATGCVEYGGEVVSRCRATPNAGPCTVLAQAVAYIVPSSVACRASIHDCPLPRFHNTILELHNLHPPFLTHVHTPRRQPP